MLSIKSIIVKNLKKLTLTVMVIILFLSTVIQILSVQQLDRENAMETFGQIEQILEENSAELGRVQNEYAATCLNDARTVAYILEYNPTAGGNVEELKKIAANAAVDEIHIFNREGVIIAGTHPKYFGLSFDSGEQMGFFKPLLSDQSLELVQDITPNTAEGKLVQYSALWSEDRNFILQIGMYPDSVLRITKKNELSYIFSLLCAGTGYSLYAISPETKTVVGSTVLSDVGKDAAGAGFQAYQLELDGSFYASPDRTPSYCLSRMIGGNYIVWASPMSSLYQPVFSNDLLLMAGLILISVILVYAVTGSMNRAVIDQIQRINENLRTIENGDLTTKVAVEDTREFRELSAHINSMVTSLLQSSEKLEMSEQIKRQKEELELQHDQLETAVERAEAANRAKSEFLFNMSHDIRTPMNAIIGFTQLALESGETEAQREYLQNIDVSSKQLLDILNNILELSKIENHKVVIEEELADVSRSFREMYTVFDSELKKKHLRYEIKLDVQHPYIYLDTTHYSQIVLNLISNAIKYTPDGGLIRVSLRELPGGAPDTCVMETVVQDTGIGMSREFLVHAYESFARERTSTDSGQQGTGLGLAIVKNLTDLMRGEVSIESEQGRGTKVTLRLPHRLGETKKVPDESETPDYARFEGKRALLAEDIDINAIISTKLLTGKGFLVERARDGVECVNMLLKAKAGYYDLVLMDIQMPNMDGYKAAQTIRAFSDPAKASIPIVALTANAFKEDFDKAIEAGMNGHIAKPLDAAKMFQSIAEVLS